MGTSLLNLCASGYEFAVPKKICSKKYFSYAEYDEKV
jgi:hypothetical protein